MAEAAFATARASIDIRAPVERVFDAWLDPVIAARFLAAGETVVSEARIDARVGGGFRIVMRGEAEDFPHEGRYIEIVRPNRLVFTWASRGTHGRNSLVTVTFSRIAEGTRVDLVHEQLPASMADPHVRGWTSILEKLARLLAAAEESSS